jgi:membrane protein YdbS with pleckstrin-like domain
MEMTLEEIRSVKFWLGVFSYAARFIYIIAIISIAASIVYWELHTNWWIIGSAAAVFLMANYLERMLFEHNMRVIEEMIRRKLAEQFPKDDFDV